MRYFKVVMSSGNPIRIGDDELPTVVGAIAKKIPLITCKRGIFNPSFYVSIVVDTEYERTMWDAGDARQRLERDDELDAPFKRLLDGKLPKQLR